MATRDEVRMLREARAGLAFAQLALAKRYLSGEGSFGRNLPTALYWLERAALQGMQEAWLLMGREIPLDVVQRAPNRAQLVRWFEQAFDVGVVHAGLVFSALVLEQRDPPPEPALRDKAMRALECAAAANILDAQHRVAQELAAGRGEVAATALPQTEVLTETQRTWLMQAAGNGVRSAQRLLADSAWCDGDRDSFLQWALPLAQRLLDAHHAPRTSQPSLGPDDVLLMRRCAELLARPGRGDMQKAFACAELAAAAGDKDAQFALGLWFSKMTAQGERDAAIPTPANYARALHWLKAAAAQDHADAWYLISRIYGKPDYQRNAPTDAHRYLEQAAEAGHIGAQLELGRRAWRARHTDRDNDVRAAYWLKMAAAHGDREAQQWLEKVVGTAVPAPWADAALLHFGADVNPFLRARVELATLFGLTRPEALLLNLHGADRRHCLLVDIEAHLTRSKRRLILITSREQRECLNRATRLFEQVDCSPRGPEGSYRKRLYRLQAALSSVAATLPDSIADLGSRVTRPADAGLQDGD